MLGKVRVEALIARGGMAEVFLGTHLTLQRQVAVKILRNQYEDDADLLERFQREARVVAKLRHQNIVQVFDYDAIDDRPYIVMEYVQGPSLSKHLSLLHKKNARLELPAIDHILTDVASALQYAHESGIVHRDIKPGNVILTSRSSLVKAGEPLPRDFEPLLTDFGLVRFLNSSRQTSAGQTAGTPAYMSPEQARGELTDERTDIYSLGIVLYEMLTGRIPFDGESTMSILLKHITDPPPPIPGLSPSLQMVLDKALAKNREDRYQTPVEFARAFHAAISGNAEQSTLNGLVPVSTSTARFPVAAEPVDSLIVVKTPPARFPWRVVLLAVVALALGGVIYFVSTGAASPVDMTATVTASSSIAPSPTITEKPTLVAASNLLGSTAILHFRDGSALMDRAVLEALALPAPPAGFQYEGWLMGADQSIRLGILEVDPNGKGELTYDSPEKVNLLAVYDRVEIRLKAVEAASGESDRVAYAYSMSPEALVYLRQLLVSAPDLPGQPAYLQGLASDTKILQEKTDAMLKAYAGGDLPGAKKQAEDTVNLLSGNLSGDNKDWNGDSRVAALGIGYGYLLNGANQGYVQALYATADYTMNALGANQNMVIFGGQVKTCAQNLASWTEQLKQQTLLVLSANTLGEADAPIQAVADLTRKLVNGEDTNGNLISEPLPGECGLATTYNATYAMADMPLLLLNESGTPVDESGTPIPNVTIPTKAATTATKAVSTGGGGGGGSSGGGTQATPVPTQKVPPGQNKPTNEPKPTNDNAGGGNNNGGGNDKPTKAPKP